MEEFVKNYREFLYYDLSQSQVSVPVLGTLT